MQHTDIHRRLKNSSVMQPVKPITINFTPHLVPMNRGILATAYASLTRGRDQKKQIRAAYDKYYKPMKSLSVYWKPGVCPETRWVEGSNYVDVNFKVDPRTTSCHYDGSHR